MIILRIASAFRLVIGRKELPFAAGWTLFLFHNPGSSTLLMVQVLAPKFNNFLIVQDSYLANGTHLGVFLIFLVYRLHPPLLYLIERYVFNIFIDFLENAGILLEPFLGSLPSHDLHRWNLILPAKRSMTGYMALSPRLVRGVISELEGSHGRHLQEWTSLG